MSCITHAGRVAIFALERKSLNKPNEFTNELGASQETLKNIKKILHAIKESEDRIKLHKDLNQKLSINDDDSANFERASFNELSQLALLLKTLLRTSPELAKKYLSTTILSNIDLSSNWFKSLEEVISFYGEIDAYANIAGKI